MIYEPMIKTRTVRYAIPRLFEFNAKYGSLPMALVPIRSRYMTHDGARACKSPPDHDLDPGSEASHLPHDNGAWGFGVSYCRPSPFGITGNKGKREQCILASAGWQWTLFSAPH